MLLIDYLVIGGFSLLVLLTGLSFRHSGESMKNFFAAGGALPWWLSGLSLFMSFFSAGTFVVWGSIAYELGWVSVTIQWMMGLAGLLIGAAIAGRWREQNILTVGEFIGRRFGDRLRRYYSYVFLLLGIVSAGAFLYPVAKLFNVSTGLSIEWSILVLGLLIIAYTAVGGLWAVIITDVLQFVILFSAVLMVLPLALDRIDGLSGLLEQAPPDFFAPVAGEYTPLFLLSFLFYNTIFIGGNWAYVQRYTSVARVGEAKKVGYLFAGLYLISPVLWMLPPMAYRIMDGGALTGLEAEGAFLMVCQTVLPSGLLGLLLGGMIFATASSVNTTLNMSAAVFTNDIYGRYLLDEDRETPETESRLMFVARISTIVFGLLTIGFALLVPRLGGIVEVVLSVGAITGAPLFAPPIWALFSERITARHVVIASLGGLGINLFFKFISGPFLSFGLDRSWEMLVGVFSPLILLAICEFGARNGPRQSATRSVPKRIPATATASTAENGDNRFALRILGNTLIATSLIILLLGVFGKQDSRTVVILVGSLVLAVGVSFRGSGRARNHPRPR